MPEPKGKNYLRIGIKTTEVPITGPISIENITVQREEYSTKGSKKGNVDSTKAPQDIYYMEIGIRSTRLPVKNPIDIDRVNVERETDP